MKMVEKSKMGSNRRTQYHPPIKCWVKDRFPQPSRFLYSQSNGRYVEIMDIRVTFQLIDSELTDAQRRAIKRSVNLGEFGEKIRNKIVDRIMQEVRIISDKNTSRKRDGT